MRQSDVDLGTFNEQRKAERGTGVRTDFENTICEVVKYATALHGHDRGSDLVMSIGRRKLLYSQDSETMYSCRRHRDFTAIVRTRVTQRVDAKRLRESPGTCVDVRQHLHGAQSRSR